MLKSDPLISSATAASFAAACHSKECVAIIEDEPDWRRAPSGAARASSSPRVTMTRWRSREERTLEVDAKTAADNHVIAIVLRNENARLTVAGRTVHDGPAMPGMLHVTEPAAAVRCLFRGAYDVLHLHVPNRLIAAFGRELFGKEATVLPSGASLAREPMAEPLGRALLDAEAIGGSFGQLYADSISTAIVARLVSAAHRADPTRRSKVSGLPKWRLKRAVDYIEANLAESVSLADIAATTGLTRMHFAAQFKAATGFRPHEYLLRRRIERAQEMLVETPQPVVDVALSVGFQTQSHFTTVFSRFVGQPPQAWRQSQG